MAIAQREHEEQQRQIAVAEAELVQAEKELEEENERKNSTMIKNGQENWENNQQTTWNETEVQKKIMM